MTTFIDARHAYAEAAAKYRAALAAAEQAAEEAKAALALALEGYDADYFARVELDNADVDYNADLEFYELTGPGFSTSESDPVKALKLYTERLM